MNTFWGTIFAVILLLIPRPVLGGIAERFSEPLADDNYESLLANLTSVRNIYELEVRGLTKGHADFEPWSGSYWPTHKGLLSQRYADDRFNSTNDIKVNYDYFVANPSTAYLIQDRVDQLSPAEKYDLLVGDPDWSLSKSMWARGLQDIEAGIKTPTWTGICHGWAAATQQGIKPPVHSVVVPDATMKTPITFFPHDIKALISYVWAESAPSTVQSGKRCRQTDVVKDSYLRPVDPSCLDGNPMSWHLAVTNRMGQYKKSFVMDANWGDEVWNYAISSYDYSYFNPKTFETMHSLKRAIEPIENMTSDRFKAYRSPRARYVVGIVMDVFHPGLISPSASESNVISHQVLKFYYDLELDANFQIVGGEWYSEDRPDFIWTFPENAKTIIPEDHGLAGIVWDPQQPVPPEFATRGIAAGKRGRVLMSIVQVLLDQSQPAEPTDPNRSLHMNHRLSRAAVDTFVE